MEQKIIKAEELNSCLREIKETKKVHHALLVCGNSFRRQELYQKLCDACKEEHMELTEFSDFSPNPKYESVISGIRTYRENGCDLILAAGGGSAMDVAKCIKLFQNMKIEENCLKQEIVPNEIPFLAIPTTAGTGSEATRFAVIYYEGNKQSVSHESSIPGYVLMAPSLLDTLPEYQRKATMLDALCHAVESFWSVNATENSQKTAAEAIRMVLAYEKAYLANEPEGNEKMLLAANLAGKAINDTKTTAGHAMAYKLTTLHGFAHGHAVALCVDVLWPYMVEHTSDSADPRGKEYLDAMFLKLASAMGCSTSMEAARNYHQFFTELNLSRPAIQSEEELSLLAGSVNPERLGNNPVRLEKDTLRNLYRQLAE